MASEAERAAIMAEYMDGNQDAPSEDDASFGEEGSSVGGDSDGEEEETQPTILKGALESGKGEPKTNTTSQNT